MPQYPDGTKVKEAQWDRLIESIPSSYSIFKDGSTYYAEALLKGGTDYSGTDASTVIQAALDALTTGGKISLKNPNYTINTALNIANPNILLEGVFHPGAETVAISLTAGAAISDLITFNTGANAGYSLGVRNLVLNGASKGCNGLTLTRGNYCLVENVRILGCAKGLNLVGTAKSSFRNMRLEQNTHGIYLIDDSGVNFPPNELLFKRVDSVDNTEYGIYANPTGAFTLGLKSTFEQCVIESNHEWGGYFYNANWITFDRCLFESNNKDVVASRDDLHIEYATERDAFISVEDCDFIGTDVTYSLNLDGADHIKVENSYLNDAVRMSYCKYGSVTSNDFVATPTISNVFNVRFSGNQGYGDIQTIEHHTAADTLTLVESGSIHTNLGAGGNIEITLPQDAVAGTTFEFVVMAANQLQISPGAAGAIYWNGAKQGDDKHIWADDEGESVKLVCDGNNDWAAMYTQGTWTVEV